ncbi:hypothetical protein [Bradyrhizobium sp. HKCCYLS20291]|uniref:hypothetical protein n=1 Tax=Bradyrhizobium sp. HKCCYLS20291 TaxID=3420766 RepID=UPI003EBCC5B3
MLSSMKRISKSLREAVQVMKQRAAAREAENERVYEKIQLFGRRDGIYVGFRRPTFLLDCTLGDVGSVELSLDEARMLFQSIREACERQDIVKVNSLNLSWTTDARPRSKDPDKVVVRFRGGLGGLNIALSREQLLAASDQFFATFRESRVFDDA